MIENFNGILYLVLFLINLAALGFYGFLTALENYPILFRYFKVIYQTIYLI